MKPPCTAPCDQRAMLELAIGAMVNQPCPFEIGAPFSGSLHVSFGDEECYALHAAAEGDFCFAPHCRACITEYLEEAIEPDPAIVVGGDVSWVVRGTPTCTPTA